MQRYHQLLLPVLKLVGALLTSLQENKAVASGVIDFVVAHYDLFLVILKNQCPVITTSSLKELRCTTSIFHRLAQHDCK